MSHNLTKGPYKMWMCLLKALKQFVRNIKGYTKYDVAALRTAAIASEALQIYLMCIVLYSLYYSVNTQFLLSTRNIYLHVQVLESYTIQLLVHDREKVNRFLFEQM